LSKADSSHTVVLENLDLGTGGAATRDDRSVVERITDDQTTLEKEKCEFVAREGIV
jgi:hypothetical protein